MSSSQSTQHIQAPSAGAHAEVSGSSVAGELRQFLERLLEAQCELVGGVAAIAYLGGSERRAAGVFARWPGHSEVFEPQVLQRLERLGAEATQGKAGAGRCDTLTISSRSEFYDGSRVHRVLIAPLVAVGRTEGATLVVLPTRSVVDESEALNQLRLANARFEGFLWQQQALAEGRQKALLRETLELMDAAQQGETAAAMGSLMCHELARRFGCTRVSIGLIHGSGDRIRLAAISGSENVDRRAAAVEALEAAMEECALQDIELVYPPPAAAQQDPSARRVLRAHERLSAAHGPSAMLSLPLRVEGDLVGVVVMEREAGDPFPPGSTPLLRLVAEFIGPALWTRRLADRGVLAVTRDRTRDFGAALVGPRHTGKKLLGLLVLLLLVLGAFVPIPARVTADAEVQASVRRSIVPPFTGHLSEVLVRPGARVRAGDILARLDTQQLELERMALRARIEELRTQRDAMQSAGRLGEAQTAQEQINAANADLALVEDRLERSQVRSPIDGLISRGDIEDFVDARVDPTQPLFEVVTEDRLVLVRVDERDVSRVEVGQAGQLASKARPGELVPIVVRRVNPSAEPVAGANVYLLEAELAEAAPWLRPGMSGTVRLDAGRTTALRAFLRPIVDELRLKLWW